MNESPVPQNPEERLDRALAQLRSLPRVEADPWFTERTLERALHEAHRPAHAGRGAPRWSVFTGLAGRPGLLLAASAASALLLGYAVGALRSVPEEPGAPSLGEPVLGEPAIAEQGPPAAEPGAPVVAAALLPAQPVAVAASAADERRVPQARLLEVRRDFDALRAELELLAELHALRQPVVAVTGDDEFDYVFDFAEVSPPGAHPVNYQVPP